MAAEPCFESNKPYSVAADQRSEGSKCFRVPADFGYESNKRKKAQGKMLTEFCFFAFLVIF